MRFKEKSKLKIDPSYYDILAMVESSGNPNAKAPTSSAAGLYQFTKGTWQGLVKQSGLDYTLDDRFDPIKSKKVVELLTSQNEKYLEDKIGNVGKGELYLAHFLGMGGAGKLLTADFTQTVDSVVGGDALKANKSVFYKKDGSIKTVGEIQNWARNKFGESPIDYVQEENSQQPTYEYPNPVEETVNVAESTKVATPDFNPELEYQNTLLKEQLNTYKSQQQEADKLSVAEQAQYKLDKKVKERDFIKDLILQTGAQFVQPEQTRSVYEG